MPKNAFFGLFQKFAMYLFFVVFLKNFDYLLYDAYLHDAIELFDLVLPWEDGVSGVKFSQDASQGPHVYGGGVLQPQDDLW